MSDEPRFPRMELDEPVRPAPASAPASEPAPASPEPNDELVMPLEAKTLLSRHREPRSKLRKFTGALFIAVGVLTVLVPLAHVLWPAEDDMGEVIQVSLSEGGNPQELYYKDVSRQEADRLIDFLVEVDYFQRSQDAGKKVATVQERLAELKKNGETGARRSGVARNGATVQLSREGTVYVVSFVVWDGTWDKPEARQGFAELRQAISHSVFDGEPVEVRLCESVPKKNWLTNRAQLSVRWTSPAG